MTINRKLVSNTVFLFTDWFVVTLIGFVYWLVAGKILLPEEYGMVSTSLNLAAVLSGISLLGLNTAVWKLIPEYLAKHQDGKVNALIKFSIKTVIVSNLIICATLIFFSGYFSPILKIPEQGIILTGLIILILSLATQFGMIIYGFQNMRKFLTTDAYGQTVKVVLSASLLIIGFRYLGPLIGYLVGFVVIAALRFLAVPIKKALQRIDVRKIISDYALPAFITNLSMIVFLNGQYVLLTILQNLKATGLFTIAMILTIPIAIIPTTMTSALLPITSELCVDKKSGSKQSYLINLVFRYSLMISLPIALFLIIFSEPLIIIFSRAEYLPASQLFPVVALASIIYGLGNVFLQNIYAIGKTRINRNIVIVTTISFFAFAIPLIMSLSAMGLAIAYALSVIILFALSLFYIRKFLKITLPFNSFSKLFVASILASTFLYFSVSLTSNLILEIILLGAAGLIYLSLLVPMRFYIGEDIRALHFLGEKIKFLRKPVSFLTKTLSKYV